MVYDANANEAMTIKSSSMAHPGMSSSDIESDDCCYCQEDKSEDEDKYVGDEPLLLCLMLLTRTRQYTG